MMSPACVTVLPWLLTSAGYGVSTAEHGFEALLQLERRSLT